MTLLDEALSEYDFRERHARYVDAPPDRVDAAVRAVTIRDMPLARVLFALRAAPTRLRRKPTRFGEIDVPLLGLALDIVFGPLGEDPGEEVASGMIGQPWKLVGGETRRFERPEEFTAFAEPGFVKAAMSFRCEPAGGGHAPDDRDAYTVDRSALSPAIRALLLRHPPGERTDEAQLAARGQAPRRAVPARHDQGLTPVVSRSGGC